MALTERPTLHLIMGLPGAGKTTLAKILQKITRSARLSSDDYRLVIYPEPTFSQNEHDNLYALIDHSAEHLLSTGHSVIYDANLNRYVHRKEKYELAKKFEARVILWWVKTPKSLSKQRRLDEQDTLLLPKGETSEMMFERIAEILEEPKSSEPVIEIDGTDIDPAKISEILKSVDK
ncbi:ATP-binding protein [Candidatus Saccharibacteria bacterium]|nr:ATP-binding protein [Candidatus Saccharibacteria bacterium]